MDRDVDQTSYILPTSIVHRDDTQGTRASRTSPLSALVGDTVTIHTPPTADTRPVAVLRDEVSVSEVLRYVACPHRHLYSDLTGMRTTRLELPLYRPDAELPPTCRGDIIHEVLRRSHELPAAGLRELVDCAVSQHAPPMLTVSDAVREDLAREAEGMLGHPLMHRIARERLMPAMQIDWRVRPWLRVTGELDLLVLDHAGRAIIVDYKTDRIQPGADDIEWREMMVEKYALQAALYTLAVNAATGRGVVSSFYFAFTDVGMVARAPIDAETLARAERTLLEAAAVITACKPALYGTPYWSQAKCTGCPWERVCLPEGRPVE